MKRKTSLFVNSISFFLFELKISWKIHGLSQIIGFPLWHRIFKILNEAGEEIWALMIFHIVDWIAFPSPLRCLRNGFRRLLQSSTPTSLLSDSLDHFLNPQKLKLPNFNFVLVSLAKLFPPFREAKHGRKENGREKIINKYFFASLFSSFHGHGKSGKIYGPRACLCPFYYLFWFFVLFLTQISRKVFRFALENFSVRGPSGGCENFVVFFVSYFSCDVSIAAFVITQKWKFSLLLFGKATWCEGISSKANNGEGDSQQ